MARLVSGDGREAAIEASIREALLAHGFELEALSGQRYGRLDDDVIQGDALDKRVKVLRVAGQALSGRARVRRVNRKRARRVGGSKTIVSCRR